MGELLFDKMELNKIIHTLRTYNRQVFGNCGAIFNPGVNEARLVTSTSKLIPKNSASLTDVILSNAEIGIGRTRQKFRVAMKMWFGWDNLKKGALRRGFNSYCKTMGRKPECDDARKAQILQSLILPYTHKVKTVNDLYESALASLADVNNTISLDYEARLYSYITENIIMRNVSPNFVPLLSANSCLISEMIKTFKTIPDFSGRREILTKLELINTVFGDDVALRFIITGSGSNMVKFKELVRDHTLTKEEAGSVVFQAFYAIYVMDKYNIFHADMHAENLFVQILDKPVTLHYMVNGNDIKFTTKYIFKVYDFDRSFLDLLGENVKASDYIESGMDIAMRRNVDFAHFLCLCIQHETESKSVTKPFTNVLADLDLAEIGTLQYEAKPLNEDDMGLCEKSVVHLDALESANIISWIKSNPSDVRDIEPTRKFIRISPDMLKKAISHDSYKTLIGGVFTDRYIKIVDKLLLQYTIDSRRKTVTLYACLQWLCSPTNDIRVMIGRYFENVSDFGKLVSVTPSVIPVAEVLSYTFKLPDAPPFIPPESLNDLFASQQAMIVSVEDESEDVTTKRTRKEPIIRRRRLTEAERLKMWF